MRRSGPNRNPPLLKPLERSSGNGNGAASPIGRVIDDSIEAAQRLVKTADAAVTDAVERGVETAYMVIEEYLQRGRAAAARRTGNSSRRRYMSNDSYDSNWGNNPSGSVPPFMAPWLQFMRLWTQSMTAFMPGGSNLPNDWLNAFMPGLSARPPLSIRVASPNPATVTVQFAPMAEYRPTLKTESLTHQKAPDLPKIKPANIQTRNGRVHISLNIPATQPAGRYRGYILDSNGDRCGRLTVEVQTPAAAE